MMNRDDVEVLQRGVAQGYLSHEQKTVWFLERCHMSTREQSRGGTPTV